MSKTKVKFLIDKKQKRVVFAEAGRHFVDVLFSFLALPLGRIVRLLNKQSGLGSLDSLYESVERLDAEHLRTEACKDMLLNPRSGAAELCGGLKVANIHEPNPWDFFICNEDSCLVKSTTYYTYARNCSCICCGKLMDKHWGWRIKAPDEGGIFLNDISDFMITDDLQVMPISLMAGCSLLKEMQINRDELEERVVDFGTHQTLSLLRGALVSKNALTAVCFPDAFKLLPSEQIPFPFKEETVSNDSEQKIILKLLLNKESSKVLCAEVGGDFVDQLVSFLTFPLGHALRFLEDDMPLGGCISNLYSSAKNIGLELFQSESCKNMLIAPKLSTFYRIKKQMLECEEIAPEKITISTGCTKCYLDNGQAEYFMTPCGHGIREAEVVEMNPKSTRGVIDPEGDFAIESRRFMVSDNLNISSPSLIAAIGDETNYLRSFDVDCKEVCLDKMNIQLLLGAMLVSKSVLTNVFSLESQSSEKKPLL